MHVTAEAVAMKHEEEGLAAEALARQHKEEHLVGV